ncbi:hypothetical protein BpHYR1_006938 [Brachionus plicatilis]|uniref:Uncharacterized protein n=1 Tax=Brachionus plicatilis TaxID=10195 RepID=A0A3M7SG57_BRAPC|nr:hypothetical protein BpHYR1_006938 [Brachionus plicatilis]
MHLWWYCLIIAFCHHARNERVKEMSAFRLLEEKEMMHQNFLASFNHSLYFEIASIDTNLNNQIIVVTIATILELDKIKTLKCNEYQLEISAENETKGKRGRGRQRKRKVEDEKPGCPLKRIFYGHLTFGI